METNDYEYRFKDVIDLDTREGCGSPSNTDAQPDQSDVRPRAHQSKSGAEQPGLQARPRQHAVDDVVTAFFPPPCGGEGGSDSSSRGITVPSRSLSIGGSLGGLLAAHIIRSVSWDVVVFERNAEELASRGVGLGTTISSSRSCDAPASRSMILDGHQGRRRLFVSIVTATSFCNGHCIVLTGLRGD